MITEKELGLIKRRFDRLIKEEKITRPKPGKTVFFRIKADDCLILASELVRRKEYLDWAISISYYSMFYNATSLLSSRDIDLVEIDESVHSLTYQALVYYFFIKDDVITSKLLEEFKEGMVECDVRIQYSAARQRSGEVLNSYQRAKAERGKVTYELGKTAEFKSAESTLRRAKEFSMLVERIMSD